MKYPKLKCEDKQNTKVCSLTIQKMKEMRKKGLNYSQIAKSLKISENIVGYHISPFQNNSESLERRRAYNRKYQNQRYNNDPEYRRKVLDSINKHHKDKRANDPKFRKWASQLSAKNHFIWRKKQIEKHPTWLSACVVGSHETTNHKSRCKNSLGNCKCPCHKK